MSGPVTAVRFQKPMPCVRSPRLCARVIESRSRSSSLAALGGYGVEHRLFAIDLGFDGGLRFLRGLRVADLQQPPEAAGDRTPLLAVVPAHAADRADRDALLGPARESPAPTAAWAAALRGRAISRQTIPRILVSTSVGTNVATVAW